MMNKYTIISLVGLLLLGGFYVNYLNNKPSDRFTNCEKIFTEILVETGNGTLMGKYQLLAINSSDNWTYEYIPNGTAFVSNFSLGGISATFVGEIEPPQEYEGYRFFKYELHGVEYTQIYWDCSEEIVVEKLKKEAYEDG